MWISFPATPITKPRVRRHFAFRVMENPFRVKCTKKKKKTKTTFIYGDNLSTHATFDFRRYIANVSEKYSDTFPVQFFSYHNTRRLLHTFAMFYKTQVIHVHYFALNRIRNTNLPFLFGNRNTADSTYHQTSFAIEKSCYDNILLIPCFSSGRPVTISNSYGRILTENARPCWIRSRFEIGLQSIVVQLT